ncbi:MAG: CpsD/CapB family tyrosine-protein kinase [Planctomycetaceae bacterium]
MQPITIDMTPLAKTLKIHPGAAVPTTPDRGNQVAVLPERLAKSGSWESTLAMEQIHVLATHVLARHAAKSLNTVAVTSALSSEGKTTIALCLASKLAAAGKRVLVIDLDTHRGTLSDEVMLPDARGAFEVLSSTDTIGEIPAYQTDSAGLFVLPRGRINGQDAIPLPQRERIRSLIGRALQQRFDILVIDCPPLVPVADTFVIRDVVDSAIMVVRANSTPRQVVHDAVTEFGITKFMAAVLNRASPSDIPYFREVYGYYRRNHKK